MGQQNFFRDTRKLFSVAPLGLEMVVTSDQGMNPLAMLCRPVGASAE